MANKKETKAVTGLYANVTIYDDTVYTLLSALDKICKHEKIPGFKKCIISCDELEAIQDLLTAIKTSTEQQ